MTGPTIASDLPHQRNDVPLKIRDICHMSCSKPLLSRRREWRVPGAGNEILSQYQRQQDNGGDSHDFSLPG